MTRNNPNPSMESWFNKLQYRIDYYVDRKANADSHYSMLSILLKKNKCGKNMVRYHEFKKVGRGWVRRIYIHISKHVHTHVRLYLQMNK